MKTDPVSGPLTRDELRALTEAPYGAAVKEIRKHDPLFGLKEGEKIAWRVTASARMVGTAHVKAASKEEAEREADELNDAAFDWEPASWPYDDVEITSVEPAKP